METTPGVVHSVGGIGTGRAAHLRGVSGCRRSRAVAEAAQPARRARGVSRVVRGRRARREGLFLELRSVVGEILDYQLRVRGEEIVLAFTLLLTFTLF